MIENTAKISKDKNADEISEDSVQQTLFEQDEDKKREPQAEEPAELVKVKTTTEKTKPEGIKSEPEEVPVNESEKEPEEPVRLTAEDKRQELEDNKGLYSEKSIVLSDTNEETLKTLSEKIGASYRMTKDGSYGVLYLPEDSSIEEVFSEEEIEAFVPEMSPDYYAHVSAMDATGRTLIAARPNYEVIDDMYSQQSYLDYLNLSDTWNVTKGENITVAIIDTGIDTDHREFAGRISEYSYNASEDKVVKDYGMEVIEDEHGHGTQVAGVLAAGMDSYGITGIAPNVNLIIIKCECDEYGRFVRSSDLVFGLAYAIERDADVVNMSFGTDFNIYSKYTALAKDSDIICIASAGNEGSSLPVYPAADPYVIGVGAMDQETWSRASYSNYGDNVKLLAPGTTFSAAIDGGYQYTTGTSVSCPIVAGAAALYLSQHPHTDFDTMEALFEASSIDLLPLGADWENGFGLLDIYALVCAEKGILTYDMLTEELPNETQIFVRGRTIQKMPEPERENVVLDGWFYDTEQTEECGYYTDVFTEDTTLFAGWINEDEGTAFIYTVLPDDTIEINSYTGRRRFLTVPQKIEGKNVSSIGEFAFSNNDRLRSVVLPETLTNIGQYAFSNMRYLRTIDIPEQVAAIGNHAFNGCANLTQVNFRQNSLLATIGEAAFAFCGIRSFTIPANLQMLGEDVFYGSRSLQSVVVAEGNTHFAIRSSALFNAGCDTLLYYPAGLAGSYTVPGSTKTIGLHAFAYANSTEIVLPESVETLGNGAFQNSSIRKLTIPGSVRELGEALCRYCYDLSELTLSRGQYTVIPSYCFLNCVNLKNVEIPEQITNIHESAFRGSGLRHLTFSGESHLEEIGDYTFYATPLEDIVIPASVTGIGEYAFQYCGNLHGLSFAENSGCAAIGREAFASCTSLKNVILPDALVTLNTLAFYGSGLEEVTVGAGLTSLGDGTFSGCEELQVINVAEGNPKYSSYDGVVYNKAQTELLMVPGARSGSYTLPGTVDTIAPYAFAGVKKITEVNLNSGLKKIGKYAFSECTSLTSQTLPDTLQIIDEGAFKGCTSIRSFTMPGSLTTIGEEAFSWCTSLAVPVTIPANVVSLGQYAFFNDYSLQSITIHPDSRLSRIGYATFAGCGITDFTVPDSISTMGQEVFTACRNLVTVTFEGDNLLTNLAAWTFRGADNLRQITFEEGSHLRNIEARACEGLTKLERITLEYCTELDNIDNYAFLNCSSLAEITLPESLTQIGRFAFSKCAALTEIRIPYTVDFIGSYAFSGTGGLSVYFRSAVLPAHLQENWDYGIAGYYMGISGIQTSDDGEWTYALTEDGKASILAYHGSASDITLGRVDGYEVVSIGGGAFKDNASLQHIALPETLTGIYAAAFKGTSNLQSISVPAAVTMIDNEAFMDSGLAEITFAENAALSILGRYVFANTKNLTQVNIPSGVDKLRDYSFYESSVETVAFGENSALTEVGRYAFASSDIASIALPDSVRKIDYNAFRETDSLADFSFGNPAELMVYGEAFYHSGLQEISIPAGVSYLGEFCFTASPDLESITVDTGNGSYCSIDGVLFNKAATRLITCPAGKTGSYNIAETVTTLAFAAFEGCHLSEIHLPEDSQLITIGYRAFCDCDTLEYFNVPASVMSIDNYAFAYCDNLETVEISSESRMSGIYKGAFYNDAALTTILIPDSAQEIGDYAFYGCSSMSDVQLNTTSQLKLIGEHAFEYAGITEFKMPEQLNEIGEYAFNKARVSSLSFNDVIEYLGDYAFSDCGLEETTELIIPDTVQYLGISSLKGADSIEELTVPFAGVYKDAPEYTYDGKYTNLVSVFGGDGNTNTSLRKITITGGTTLGAVSGFENLAEINLPKGLISISSGAFGGLKNLRHIDIPESVVSMSNAFMGSGIEEITLPDNLEKIEMQTFIYCENLTNVTLPKNLKEIGYEAFTESGLVFIEIPALVNKIGEGAFSGCENLEAINVAEGNKSYKSLSGILYDFNFTKILAVPGKISGHITIPEGIEEIGPFTFRSCNKITNIDFPDSLLKIGTYAFGECKSLEKITIPDSVCYTGEWIFADCVNLQEATLLCNIDDLQGMFDGCYNLKKLILPEGLKRLSGLNYTAIEELIVPNSVIFMEIPKINTLKYLYIGSSVEEISGNRGYIDNNVLEEIVVSSDNETYASYDGILYTKDYSKLLMVPGNISGDVEIPEGVLSINDSAFVGCIKMTSIKLPDSLVSIGSFAFRKCSNLGRIDIGNNVSKIGINILEYTGYSNNDSNYENGLLYVGDYLICSTNQQEAIRIKEGTRLISAHAITSFSTKYIYLPDSVEYLNEAAFYCPNLRMMRIGKNIKEIGEQSFRDTNLVCVVYGESVHFIESQLIHPQYMLIENCEAIDKKRVFDDWPADCLVLFGDSDFIMMCMPGKDTPDQIVLYNPNTQNSLRKWMPDSVFFTNLPKNEIPDSWSQGNRVYYANEWNLCTFTVNETIIKMQAIPSGEVVQTLPTSEIDNYLLTGQTFVGWDINGDGKADTLPITLKKDLEAVAVLSTPITAVSVDDEKEMEIGDTDTLAVTFEPIYNNGNEEVVWESSDEDIVSVDEDGLLTAEAEGMATVTVTLADNENISAQCEITVVPRKAGIHLADKEGSLLKGETMTLEPEVIRPEGDESPLAWESANPEIATVEDGKITGVSGGKTDIIITCGELSATFKLTVLSPMTGISISNPVAELNAGDTYDLKLEFEPSDTTDSKNVIYTSSDESVATVSSRGKVSAIAPGQVTITVETKTGEDTETEPFSDSITIEVYAPLKWIRLNTSTGTMRIARTKQMEVIYEPSNTTDDRSVTWSSSSPEVASVDESGKVTALTKGSAVITGTVGELQDTYSVTVIGLRDDRSGIIVTNSNDTAMDDNVNLVVENITESIPDRTDELITELQEMIEQQVTAEVYDISLISGNETVQPDTPVDVEIPVTADLEHDEVAVYRAEEDGSFTDMEAEKDEGYLTFTTDHFSVYVVSVKHRFTEYKYNDDATCLADGTETAICDNPGCTRTDTRIAPGTATGHSYGEWETDEEERFDTRVCTLCGHKEIRYIGTIPEDIVKLPSALTEIEEEAFAETAFESVEIPPNVTLIADNAFDDSEVTLIIGYSEYVKQYAYDHEIAYLEKQE